MSLLIEHSHLADSDIVLIHIVDLQLRVHFRLLDIVRVGIHLFEYFAFPFDDKLSDFVVGFGL